MIKKNSVVGLHYKMYDADNNLLDETTEPMVYLHGGYDGIFPLVEEALHEKNIGDADGKAVVDGNHPLAGMKIRFQGTVESIREANAEEIAHGHAHGAHGHHHH